MFEAPHPRVVAAMQRHAIESYPRESCGLLIDGVYMPCANIHPTPEKDFQIDATTWNASFLAGQVQALVHSHPGGPDHPTKTDMEQQIATALPWGILCTDGQVAGKPFWFGDQAPVPPLDKRSFRHGVTDCYALIRDWYRLRRGVTLQDFPRDWEWWLPQRKEDGTLGEPLNLYKDGFAAAGFVEISGEERREGDVFLAEIRTRDMERAGMKPGTPNHGGIYLGRDLALHHLTARMPVDPTRLAEETPIGRYRNHITYWLRYVG